MLSILATGALCACVGADARRPRGLRPTANPSAVVATELAFARAAQDKGQWTAFAEYAADDAVMFVPQLVEAKDWLRKRTNPAKAVTWQPYSIWTSCDGSLAVSKGAWQRPDGTNGYFTTVWRRQKDGKYKWTLDQGDGLAQPLAAPEMISGDVADCSRPMPPAIPAPEAGVVQRVGWSDDKTLQWIVEVRLDGSRWFKVHRWTGSGYEEVIRSEVAAQ
jgi:ketosteroid isomerase-like protein